MLRTVLSPLAQGKLTVLLFHKVPSINHPLASSELDLARFEKVLSLASRMFRILPLHDAVVALRKGRLPERAACITFDDGYPDWIQGAVPLLERYRAHATFFVTTGQFRGVPMWNERILHAVARAGADTSPFPVPGRGFAPLALDTATHRAAAVKALDAYLKYRPPGDKEQMLLALEQHTGARLADVPVMTVEDLRAIHGKGFGIGAHAVSHPILSRCTPEQAYAEIADAKADLEAALGAPVTAFAYPNGMPGTDFGTEHVEMVKRAGYHCALTTDRGVATQSTSLFQIPRFTPWGPSLAKMELQFARNLMQRVEMLPEDTAAQKRALMVAFHFPPQAGSSGILRTLNFAKNLPDSGWSPVVLTAQPQAYEEQREDLLKDIPAHVRVLRAFALDAARHLSVWRKYPTAIALPDRWSTWWPFAVWAGLREIRRQRPDVLWSTYPIASAHLIGATLARLSGLPWVADFRDPMINGDYPSHPLQRRVWERLEARVMRDAARCVFTTERAAQTYRARYPQWAGKCVVIENGYDEGAFEGNAPLRHGVQAEQLLLLHSGIIYPRDRDPSTFFAALAALIQRGQLARKRVKVRFRAPKHADEVLALVARHGLQDVVEVAPPIPYREAIAEMLGADLLLVFQGAHFNTQIPAKIYEYLRAGRPIMGLLDRRGDTAAQLGGFQAVELCDIATQSEIEAGLLRWLETKGTAETQSALRDNVRAAERYSRVAQARVLTQLLVSLSMPAAFQKERDS